MKKYFVTDIHRSSDAWAMEKDLVEWARKIYTDVLVSEDKIHAIAQKICAEQARILAAKPRRQEIPVSWGESPVVFGHAYITIGSSQINLRLVQGEVL